MLAEEELTDKAFSYGVCTDYMKIFFGAWEKDNIYYFHIKIEPLLKEGDIRIDGKIFENDNPHKTVDDYFSYCLKMYKEEIKL